MANLKSSKKQAKKNIKHRNVNLARKTAIKNAVKKVLEAIAASDVAKAQDSLKAAQAQISRAKGKGLLHGNNAARKMSRLSAKVVALKKSK